MLAVSQVYTKLVDLLPSPASPGRTAFGSVGSQDSSTLTCKAFMYVSVGNLT